MTNAAKALIKWLTDNVLKAYQEPVGKSATLPYISVTQSDARNLESEIQPITIYYKSEESYSALYGYVDTLAEKLGDTGVIISGTDCKLWVKKGNPFAVNLPQDEKTIHAVRVNLEISYYL